MRLKYITAKRYLIRCSKCGIQDIYIENFCDKNKSPQKVFKNKGWTTFRGKTICSRCSKKIQEKES